jgi:hypothetical protein
MVSCSSSHRERRAAEEDGSPTINIEGRRASGSVLHDEMHVKDAPQHKKEDEGRLAR